MLGGNFILTPSPCALQQKTTLERNSGIEKKQHKVMQPASTVHRHYKHCSVLRENIWNTFLMVSLMCHFNSQSNSFPIAGLIRRNSNSSWRQFFGCCECHTANVWKDNTSSRAIHFPVRYVFQYWSHKNNKCFHDFNYNQAFANTSNNITS